MGYDDSTMVSELDPKKTAIVLGPVSAGLLSPIVFHIVRKVKQEDSFKSDFIAILVTSLLCITFMALISIYLKYYQRHLLKQRPPQQRSILQKLFLDPYIGLLSKDDHHENSSFHSYSKSNSPNKHDQSGTNNKRIDSKYFKPRVIYTELMTFWDTTCAVITWGSFYLIGGTIVATERMAQKIKRSSTRESSFKNASISSNKGTGKNYSFMNFNSSSSDVDVAESQETENCKHAYKKISTWSKRSFSSAKKKFSRLTNQLSVAPTTNNGHRNNIASRSRLFRAFQGGEFLEELLEDCPADHPDT